MTETPKFWSWCCLQQRSPPPSVHHPTCLSPCLQDRLTVEAPKRHKVSVHVLSREMDSCEYLCSFQWDTRRVHSSSGWPVHHCVSLPGPIVGEFPAQNDVNLAPAPSLPQVTMVFCLYALRSLTWLHPQIVGWSLQLTTKLHTAHLCLLNDKLLHTKGKRQNVFELLSGQILPLQQMINVRFQCHTFCGSPYPILKFKGQVWWYFVCFILWRYHMKQPKPRTNRSHNKWHTHKL